MAGSQLGRGASLNQFSTGVENIPLFETGTFVSLLVQGRSAQYESDSTVHSL